MRLTWRDALASLLIVIGLAFAFSVVQGWNWPLMNGVRAGIIALGVTGFVACPVSGWAGQVDKFYKSPFFAAGTIVGVLLLFLLIAGLFVGTMVYLEWMMAGVVLIWVITLLHRLLPEGRAARPTAA